MMWSVLGYAGLASLVLPLTASAATFDSPPVYPSRKYLVPGQETVLTL